MLPSLSTLLSKQRASNECISPLSPSKKKKKITILNPSPQISSSKYYLHKESSAILSALNMLDTKETDHILPLSPNKRWPEISHKRVVSLNHKQL